MVDPIERTNIGISSARERTSDTRGTQQAPEKPAGMDNAKKQQQQQHEREKWKKK